jgi:hypothetical protein
MPEVVIIAKDGAEHVFPDGFDPKRAAAIVRGGSHPKPTGWAARQVEEKYGPEMAEQIANADAMGRAMPPPGVLSLARTTVPGVLSKASGLGSRAVAYGKSPSGRRLLRRAAGKALEGTALGAAMKYFD